MFFYTLMRASAPMHELSPEIQKIMTFMETDASWAEAFESHDLLQNVQYNPTDKGRCPEARERSDRIAPLAFSS